MQFTKEQQGVLGILAKNDSMGVSFADLSVGLHALTPDQISTALRALQQGGYAEERWEGQPWPNESQLRETTPQPARRRFRLTPKGKAALSH